MKDAAVEAEVGLEQSVRQLLVAGIDAAPEFAVAEQHRAVEDGIAHVDRSGELAMGDLNVASDMGEAQVVKIAFDHMALQGVPLRRPLAQGLRHGHRGDSRPPVDQLLRHPPPPWMDMDR